jgi:CIC family chloride channel protein
MGVRGSLPPRFTEAFRVRGHRALALAALTGGVTGVGVAGFEWLTLTKVFEAVLETPLPVQAAALVVGLGLAALGLRFVARGASPSTADEYIRNFHDRDRPLSLKPVLGRLLAGAATLGSGGALGYEGPSLYLGAAVGTGIQTRRPRRFARADSKVLMVAGAAAGVAAIFKAPATGAIFALEVPYRDDTARHMLLPALVGAATGYLAFVALLGTDPLFDVAGSPPFDLRELGGAALLGVVCGLGARGYAYLITHAKRIAAEVNPWIRTTAAGAALAGLLVASDLVLGEGLSTGSGYRTLEWVTEPGHGIWLVLALLGFRVAATTATLAGGGVGGLFIPLVIAGALIGDAGALAVGDTTNLFPLIGVAAFLGAGYRTPLAGVVFVAEATGRPGFIVPGLIASVASQLVMGDVSVSPYQSAGRRGHLERRFLLPIGSVIRADVLTVPPDASLREFYEHHLLLTRETSVPVLDGQDYLGMVASDDLREHPPEQWGDITVGDVVHPTWPAARPDWTLETALRALDGADVDTLPVLDGTGSFIGVVTSSDIVRLDEILGSTDDTDEGAGT